MNNIQVFTIPVFLFALLLMLGGDAALEQGDTAWAYSMFGLALASVSFFMGFVFAIEKMFKRVQGVKATDEQLGEIIDEILFH